MESVKFVVVLLQISRHCFDNYYRFLKDLNNGIEGKVQGVEDDENDDVVAAFGESVV